MRLSPSENRKIYQESSEDMVDIKERGLCWVLLQSCLSVCTFWIVNTRAKSLSYTLFAPCKFMPSRNLRGLEAHQLSIVRGTWTYSEYGPARRWKSTGRSISGIFFDVVRATHEEVRMVVALMTTDADLYFVVSSIPSRLLEVLRQELTVVVELVACTLRMGVNPILSAKHGSLT